MSNKEYRVCAECGKSSDEVPFYRYANGSLYKRCRRCHNLDTYQHKLNNPELLKQVYDGAAEWKRRNRHKRSTYNKVYRALQKGDLVRPTKCSVCGSSDRRIEAHHDDYDKPYDVRWLCSRCHKDFHAK